MLSTRVLSASRVLSLFQSFSSTSRVLFASTCSVSKDGKKLELLCDGEQERRYHGVWLRHNCRCPICLPPLIQQNIVHHSNLVDLKITDATVKGTGIIIFSTDQLENVWQYCCVIKYQSATCTIK